MCTSEEEVGIVTAQNRKKTVVDIDDFQSVARFIVNEEEFRRSAVGFVGYGYEEAKPGDKVLFAVDTHTDIRIRDSIISALHEKGAKVDVITVDVGVDREFDELDEFRAIIRRVPWTEDPRRYEGIPWIEGLMKPGHYDLLIMGKGGGPPGRSELHDYRYEMVPWVCAEHFQSKATVFPRDVHILINQKTWDQIRFNGEGGTVHLTDPEGTDLSWTRWPEYWDPNRVGRGFTHSLPRYGHLNPHARPPFDRKENTAGVIAGTTGHYQRPFPQIKVNMDGGKISGIEGGGKYGEAWGELWDETKNVQYPLFPGPGLFWMWECAIGTNVKIARPASINMLSSAGAEWERRRSGIIHVGIGTGWRSEAERWAGENGIAYGHLHIHLLFPTLDIIDKAGREKVRVIDNGRLTSLDDPEVRELASRYGDPDELLKEDWIPNIPGINAPGSYEEFAKDPIPWIYGGK